MGLGKNYEMAHQNIGEQLLSSELWEEREAATANLGQCAMYLASIMSEFGKLQQDGGIPADVWLINEEAHRREIDAIAWLSDVNRRIREAGL